MNIDRITVKNYKSIHNADINLSQYSCIVGENNAGKSTLMQAILLFINGTKLSPAEYYNPDEDILITAYISGANETALAKLTSEHRSKIEPKVDNGRLVLARRYSTDGTSKLRHVTNIPVKTKYRTEQISALVSKHKDNLGALIISEYPEIHSTISSQPQPKTQKAARELIEEFVRKLPPEEFTIGDTTLDTGIDNSIRALLPEPIYVPAVKDFSDDLKTKESTSFGKLLSILLDVIEEELDSEAQLFDALRKKLSRVLVNGEIQDQRLSKVQSIEATIRKNLHDTFQNVSIELDIPPPQIKAILANATILADDGVRGPVENKGDGFKRAITFSILRSYVELSQSAGWQPAGEKSKATRDKFIFLFEEPELYLHPKAQNILYEALSLISKSNQVLTTTHSPLFFTPDVTGSFIKVSKIISPELPKPVAKYYPIDLTSIKSKDKFQIISYETSNLAFFSKRIVLVEGDSEMIVLPHIASLLNSKWSFKNTSTNIVKINGKGSFKRYRDFFNQFDVPVAIIADLDILLEDFDKVSPSTKAVEIRKNLLAMLDQIIDNNAAKETPKPRLLKEELQRQRATEIISKIIDARKSGDSALQCELLEELFVFERTRPRLLLLEDENNADVLAVKRELLAELRKSGVFVLEKGAIEAYYPAEVQGQDKPTKAQGFCKSVLTGEHARSLCGSWVGATGNIIEFDEIFHGLFSETSYA